MPSAATFLRIYQHQLAQERGRGMASLTAAAQHGRNIRALLEYMNSPQYRKPPQRRRAA